MKRLGPAAVLIAAAFALATHASSSPADAGATTTSCGNVETATARHSDSSPPPLAIGDSTMLLALPSLAAAGFDVNAHGCRQYPEALSLLADLGHARQLPHLVVIALGANGSIDSAEIGQALHILGPERMLALLTPRELGGGSGSDARLVRTEGRRHGANLVVLDWVAYAAGHPGWFEPDGLHVNPAGAAAMSRLITSTLPLDRAPRAVHAPHCRPPGAVPPEAAPPEDAGKPVAHLHIAVHAPGAVLLVDTPQRRLRIAVQNLTPDQVSGVARVEEGGGGHPRLVAAACFSVPQAASAALEIPVGSTLAASAQLLEHFGVRLVLQFGAGGANGQLATRYILRARRGRTPTRRHAGHASAAANLKRSGHGRYQQDGGLQ